MLFEEWKLKLQHVFPSVAMLVLLSWLPLVAQDLTPADPPESSNEDPGSASDDVGWVAAWTRIVEKARASQPHFVAPIVTTHVMLVQQFRYDISWQQDPSGGTITSNYGGSRESCPPNLRCWILRDIAFRRRRIRGK